MNTDMSRSGTVLPPAATRFDPTTDLTPDRAAEHERAVDAIVDDCFLACGQGIGLRASFDFDTVLFARQLFRAKFLAAMEQFGNRWLDDRQIVTAVGWMLGERAVRYAAGAPSISVDAFRQAAADVERYCQLHAARRTRGRDEGTTEASTARIAGYWCTWEPKE
jgi:hypothetical protein